MTTINTSSEEVLKKINLTKMFEMKIMCGISLVHSEDTKNNNDVEITVCALAFNKLSAFLLIFSSYICDMEHNLDRNRNFKSFARSIAHYGIWRLIQKRHKVIAF